MLGISLPYLLKHPLATAVAIASDPLEIWIKLEEKYADSRGGPQPVCQYASNQNWESLLHERVGAGWPCQSTSEFWDVWREVIKELENQGIRPGPGSFRAWSDGDAGLTRAIWCLVRHLKPACVVETGVAHGVTSRFVLDALEKNEHGHLWSIDLPPLERDWQQQVGLAVGGRHQARWTYIKGSSRRRLPGLLSELGQIDLFIHDSLHSKRNVVFEMERAWPALRPGGAMVVDDVDVNGGFEAFTRAFSPRQLMICDAEPIYPDLRRFNNKGLFGIIVKD
jgi:predicted O-methyltransferase YrrM